MYYACLLRTIKSTSKKCPVAACCHAPRWDEELKNPDITELKDRHPATGGYVYGTNDPNVDRVNPAFPDPPATEFRSLNLI